VRDFQGAGEGVEGAGDQPPLSPEESLERFILPDSLAMDIVASEPVIGQPLDIRFDERGRLWVVQYLQYPFPAGLKIVEYDRYLRAVFDRVPPPPPHHTPGADKITILEDTDGDGIFDRHKNFLTGLNIVSSVEFGRGGVWVLNPPYLLFYPDRDRDDVPDGDPEVHLSGFGLEDTHSVANSLHWGPDGWLYGVTGSTTTSRIQGIHFLGQAVWRYHPDDRKFELFAEGGGNTWSLDFDSKGRAFSGTNHGATRGLHYVQGGYYIKGFSKHGPLTNPFAFGYFEHMKHEGYQPRFPQSMVIYEEGRLPNQQGRLIAGMSLTNRVQSADLLPDGSSYRTEDREPLVLTDYRWFRPVDVREGPDGALYIADWHDFRLSHLSPEDNWQKDVGRIYRIRGREGFEPSARFDLAALNSDDLVDLLADDRKWYREHARRILVDRRDASIVPRLKSIVREGEPQAALEALWVLSGSGRLEESFAYEQLQHADPYLRLWSVRLLGDVGKVETQTLDRLISMAAREPNVQVRSQLASTAKRLPAEQALPLIRGLLARNEDTSDIHIPLLLWWAMEEQIKREKQQVVHFVESTPDLWKSSIFREHLVPRLGKRFAFEQGNRMYYEFSGDYLSVYSEWLSNYDPAVSQQNLQIAARLLEAAPPNLKISLMEGMEEGLHGQFVEVVPAALQQQLQQQLQAFPDSPVVVSLGLHLGQVGLVEKALLLLSDRELERGERMRLAAALVDSRAESALPGLFEMLRDPKESADFKADLLRFLASFDNAEVAQTAISIYPDSAPSLRSVIESTLVSNEEWAGLFLEAVDAGNIDPDYLGTSTLARIKRFQDARLNELIDRHWGAEKESPRPDLGQQALIQEGKKQYLEKCSFCHLPSGDGMSRSLVGSPWVLGQEKGLVRIVLHGKVGSELTMPPFNSQLSNEEIAAILSYIRQEWGNQAQPVSPQAVDNVRRESQGRNEPWKEEELREIVGR
ncbi:MAG TPA: PVC-type heme-binding CxxCH protein, partial [Acidobacteriota bacterium]|nr:PVC-type heme-binding CxxCH protein [Acidobacteriota bacterium]